MGPKENERIHVGGRIVLVTEMTGSFTMLLPMLGACFAAMLVPALLRNAPIYDSLRQRLGLRSHESNRDR
jgi:CIC family chloride channel protein